MQLATTLVIITENPTASTAIAIEGERVSGILIMGFVVAFEILGSAFKIDDIFGAEGVFPDLLDGLGYEDNGFGPPESAPINLFDAFG